MSLLKISLAYLASRKLTTALNVLLLALGVASITVLMLVPSSWKTACCGTRKASTWWWVHLLALLLAVGPVGSYAHGLGHLFEGAPFHGHEGGPGDGHGHGEGGAPGEPQRADCDLFGAHAPLGAAAPGYVLPSGPEAPGAAAPVTPVRVVLRAPYRPYLQRAPPPDSLRLV